MRCLRVGPLSPAAAIAALGMSICGCDESTAPVSVDPAAPYEIVNEAFRDTIPFAEVAAFEPGTAMKLLVNRRGTEVRAYPVKFEGARQDGTERLLVVRIDGIVIGAGDSGSPLVTGDGRVAGILCYGAYGANHQFWARAISDVLAVGLDSTAFGHAKRSAVTGMQPLPPAYCVSGINPRLLDRLSVPSQYRNRFGVMSAAAPGAGMAKSSETPVSKIIPGMSMTLHEMSGDLVNVYAVGTVSYTTEGVLHAFGHAYNNDANRAIRKPVTLASMQSMIESVDFPFKESQPLTQAIGSLVNDQPHAVVVDRNDTAPVIALSVSVALDGVSRSSNYRVSHDIDQGWEGVLMQLAASVSVDQALQSHKRRGGARLSISLNYKDTTADTSLFVGDTLDTATTDPDSTRDSGKVDIDNDIAKDVAEAIPEFVYGKVEEPFTLRSVSVSVTLYPDTSLHYSESSWSILR